MIQQRAAIAPKQSEYSGRMAAANLHNEQFVSFDSKPVSKTTVLNIIKYESSGRTWDPPRYSTLATQNVQSILVSFLCSWQSDSNAN